MQFTRRRFVGAVAATAGVAAAAGIASPRFAAVQHAAAAPPPPPAVRAAAARPPLIDEALAVLRAQGDRVPMRDRIGVADFALPSSEPRFHIVDVASGRIESSFLVAHGRGSDPGHTGMLEKFSNAPGSNATSRGAYLTAHTYHGKYGRSQRLIGLDPHNDRALERAIVIHGAPYVAPDLITAQGRIGRSLGCFAFELSEVGNVMSRLGEGRMIYAGKPA